MFYIYGAPMKKYLFSLGLCVIFIVSILLIKMGTNADHPLWDISTVTPPPPVLTCVPSDQAASYNVLVVGESWAAGSAYFPQLADEVSKANQGQSVKICSIGYPRRNALRIKKIVTETLSPSLIREMFNGNVPNKTILLLGVNDTIEHVGEKNYAENVNAIYRFFSGFSDVRLSTIPNINEEHFVSPNLLSKSKRVILECVFDGCQASVAEKYRRYLHTRYPDIKSINYDDFIASYEDSPQMYQGDGIHLTKEAQDKFGGFLGKNLMSY